MRYLFVLILFLFVYVISFAQNDKIYTARGVDFMGTFKSMEDGVVIFSTEYSDYDFKFKWSKIVGVKITKEFVITTVDQEKYIGKIISLPAQKRIAIIEFESGSKKISLDSIDQISSVDNDFIHRFSVTASAGFTFTKANKVRQRSIEATVIYDSDKLNVNTDFSMERTRQDDVDLIRRTEGNLSLTRDAWGKVKLLGGVDFLRNTEQSLDLRSTIRAGLGGYFVRKSKINFISGAGLAYNNERYGGDESDRGSSLESFVLLKLGIDEINHFVFFGQVIVYPSICREGRFRVDSDISMRYNLPLNLFVELSYAHDIDNSPLVESSEFDFVLKTTIGWKWN